MHRKFHYISKFNKLVQLVVQVKYHVNVIYSLSGEHTHTSILILQTKTTSRNQACAGQRLACVWFKNYKCIGTTLKIDSIILKTLLELSYRILKISKITTFSSDGLPAAIRPTSTRRTAPILSKTKALAICNIDLLFKEGLSTAS